MWSIGGALRARQFSWMNNSNNDNDNNDNDNQKEDSLQLEWKLKVTFWMTENKNLISNTCVYYEANNTMRRKRQETSTFRGLSLSPLPFLFGKIIPLGATGVPGHLVKTLSSGFKFSSATYQCVTGNIYEHLRASVLLFLISTMRTLLVRAPHGVAVRIKWGLRRVSSACCQGGRECSGWRSHPELQEQY